MNSKTPYRYVKSDAFTSGSSLGNPAACLFFGDGELTAEQMQTIAQKVIIDAFFTALSPI